MVKQTPSILGFNARLSFNKDQCNKYKISQAFADMAIKDWCKEKQLAKNFIDTYGIKYTYQDALQRIKYSLNILSLKQNFLKTYCKESIEYFKAKEVADSFKDAYMLESEEFKIRQLQLISSRKGYRNAIAVTINEHDHYYQDVTESSNTAKADDINDEETIDSIIPDDSKMVKKTIIPDNSNTSGSQSKSSSKSTTL